MFRVAIKLDKCCELPVLLCLSKQFWHFKLNFLIQKTIEFAFPYTTRPCDIYLHLVNLVLFWSVFLQERFLMPCHHINRQQQNRRQWDEQCLQMRSENKTKTWGLLQLCLHWNTWNTWTSNHWIKTSTTQSLSMLHFQGVITYPCLKSFYNSVENCYLTRSEA